MTKKKDIQSEEKEERLDDVEPVENSGDETESGEPKTEETKAEETDGSETGETKAEGTKNEEESFEVKYLRMAADFQNFKRRTDEEKARIYTNANERFARDLLEVVDNFERAIEQDRNDKDADDQFLKGMEMILKQLQDVLKKNEVEEIDAIGAEFDPNFHHAVLMETSEEYDKGKVTEVMQKGYKIKDRIIRPSMVKVAE